MHRRTLLVGLLGLAATQAACQASPQERFRAAILQDAVPPQLVDAFRRSLPASVQFQSELQDSLLDLFQRLQEVQRIQAGETTGGWRWPGAAPLQERLPTWVSLGDYWLQAAIQQRLIQPFTPEGLSPWPLAEPWQPVIARDAQGQSSPEGAIWGSPYRWGCLVMVYARRPFENLGWQPQTWQDLWRSELAGRVILPDHPRTLLGLVLKSLGKSVNGADLTSHPSVTAALDALPSQVRTYSSTHYLEPLIREDAWVAVGWSTDVRPPLESYRQLGATVPSPGTLLSADLWVQPAGTAIAPRASSISSAGESSTGVSKGASSVGSLSTTEQRWLSHWLGADNAVPMTVFSNGLAVPLLGGQADSLLPEIETPSLLLPSASQQRDSEFLLPLSPAASETYRRLWQRLRGRK
jgi:putative spermidine/putrescine transport system substrate-binding protein